MIQDTLDEELAIESYDDHKKPSIVKVIIGLVILKLSNFVLIVLWFSGTRDIDESQSSFGLSIRNAITHYFHLDMSDPEFAFGRLLGILIFPTLFMIVALSSLMERRFWLTLIIVLLDLFFGFGRGFPVITILIAILLLTGTSRRYLLKRTTRRKLR